MPPTAEQQLKIFVDKFDPKHRAIIRAARQTLRKRLPSAHELVYDNYNFFVIGYGATERPSDAILSIAAGANGVSLCFLHGKGIPDPKKLLLGAGNQTRFIRLESASVLDKPDVKALLGAAVARSKAPFRAKGRGELVIRSVSAKQRPRRKAE
ncbi:MAG: DUF1801 domain-containing protein [Gemmatimonadaceae bacterium]